MQSLSRQISISKTAYQCNCARRSKTLHPLRTASSISQGWLITAHTTSNGFYAILVGKWRQYILESPSMNFRMVLLLFLSEVYIMKETWIFLRMDVFGFSSIRFGLAQTICVTTFLLYLEALCEKMRHSGLWLTTGLERCVVTWQRWWFQV